MSCVQFELRVEYCSIVKTVEGRFYMRGSPQALYAGKRGREGLPFLLALPPRTCTPCGKIQMACITRGIQADS